MSGGPTTAAERATAVTARSTTATEGAAAVTARSTTATEGAAAVTAGPMAADRAPELKLVVAGIGGQGVVYATKVLAQAGLMRGAAVIASENHGMSQRGGSVMSHLRIGGRDAPLIPRGAADALVGLDRDETMRNLAFVRPGGCVFVNAARALDDALVARLDALRIRVHALDADRRARGMGTAAVANLVLLGFAASHDAFGIAADELAAAVRALGPPAAIAANLEALAAGAEQ
jgi:indolepyruvate ferredoxin oxidoreductase, beta subunit